MRISYKLGFLAAATLAGANAFAAVDVPQNGNGELVLFVRDASNSNRVYARGLGIHVDDIMTKTEATSASYSGEFSSFTTHTALSPIAADATLTSFLAAGGNYVWTIMAGDSQTEPTPEAGDRRYVTTLTPAGDSFNLNNSLVGGTFGALDTLLGAVNINSFSATNSTAPGGLWGSSDVSAANSQTWWDAALNNENVFPTSGTSSTNLYLIANSSNRGSSAALVWQASSQVTMDSQGNLSFGSTTSVPQVPVPAAIWLLGSALAGLATVRRRRAESDAVAA